MQESLLDIVGDTKTIPVLQKLMIKREQTLIVLPLTQYIILAVLLLCACFLILKMDVIVVPIS